MNAAPWTTSGAGAPLDCSAVDELSTAPAFPLPTGEAAKRLGLALIERGYEVLLYRPTWNSAKNKFDKKPVAGGSDHATRSAPELLRRFQQYPNAAVGVRRGHGVAIVDDDGYRLAETPARTREARRALAAHELVYGVPNFTTASGGRHWYFSMLNLGGRKCAVPGFELLENNGFIAVAGELPPIDTLQPLPETLAAAFTNSPPPATPSAVHGAVIFEGGRNNFLTSEAGKRQRNGLDSAALLAALHGLNRTRCQPPLLDEEVETIAGSISKYSNGWPQPTPLPEGLPPVATFDGELLPSVLREYVADIAERMQCPVDFPAVAAMVAISSIVGRRWQISPKRADSWTVVPNLWGMIVGRPGVMKSPPLQDVLRPLQELQGAAIFQYERAMQDFKAAEVIATEGQKVQREAIRKALKRGDTGDASGRAAHLVEQDPEQPICRRYICNDATVEKLGELLRENPNGLLQFRDELTGFFRTLERQGHEADRAFYLETWNGDGSFTYDRIGRGTVHIPAACLAMLGGIQPGPLAEMMRAGGTGGDDGLIQRFQLAVYPDVPSAWRNVDRPPNRLAREGFDALIARLDTIAPHSEPVRFDALAQDLFDNWRATLEIRLRNGSEHPAMEAHLAKYRSLVPSLALLLHLAGQDAGPVGLLALEQAIGWAKYLESHARRIYAPAVSPDMDAARLLADKITRGEIGARFTLRDVYRNGWTGLATVDAASAAVRVLADFDWLRPDQVETAGRTRTDYLVNPAAIPRADAA